MKQKDNSSYPSPFNSQPVFSREIEFPNPAPALIKAVEIWQAQQDAHPLTQFARWLQKLQENRPMSMRLNGALLTRITETLQTIEESGIKVTTFRVQVDGASEHDIMLRWDEEDPGKAYVVGISNTAFAGQVTRRR